MTTKRPVMEVTPSAAPVDALAPLRRDVAQAQKLVDHGRSHPPIPGAMEQRLRALAEAQSRLAAMTDLIAKARALVVATRDRAPNGLERELAELDAALARIGATA